MTYGVLGNPDVKPEKTVQYEIGYKQILTPDLGFDLTMFYKDIRDLLGVEFIATYTGAEYARLTNVDFGNVFGLTLALDHRQVGPVQPGPRLHLAAGSGQLERSAARPRTGPPPARTRGPGWCPSTGTSGTP